MKLNLSIATKPALYIIIGIASALFFLLKVEPLLIYFQQQPAFFFDRFFISQHLNMPGGSGQLIALFFGQFFVAPIWGSIIIAALIMLYTFTQVQFINTVKPTKNALLISVFPVIAASLIVLDYNTDVQHIINLITVLWLSMLHINFSKRINPATSLVLFVVLNLALFHLLGGTALLTFSLIILLNQIKRHKPKQSIVLFATITISSAIIFLLYTNFSAYINLEKALKGIFYETNNKQTIALLAFMFAYNPLLSLFSAITKGSEKNKTNNAPKFKALPFTLAFILPLVLLIVSYLLIPVNSEKNKIEIQQLASEEQWDQVLEKAKTVVSDQRRDFFQINRALYHKGQLLENGFAVQQWYGEHGLILTPYYNSKVLMLCSDLYHDMGFIKGSLHWAYEAQTKYKLAPNVLQRIVTENLILGNYKVAQKFNHILSKSIIHKSWTEQMQTYIDGEKPLDTKLSKYASMPLLRNGYSNTQHPEHDLIYILTEHPENNMALEYLLFHAMLRHDLALVAQYAVLLETQNYTHIPKHIEEALIMAKTIKSDLQVDLKTLKISAETQKNFNDFTRMLMQHKREKNVTQAEIQQKHGNSFWYYITFVSPISTKRSFNESTL
jgi:hypothetical protein